MRRMFYGHAARHANAATGPGYRVFGGPAQSFAPPRSSRIGEPR